MRRPGIIERRNHREARERLVIGLGEEATREIGRVCVIGVGLVGGSIAAATKALLPQVAVYGIDNDPATVESAVMKGITDDAALPDSPKAHEWTSAGGCDLVVIATPAAAARYWFGQLAEGSFDGIITDTASTKRAISGMATEALDDLSSYIPGHPMAGSETSGISSASATLFQGAYWILCPDEDTDPECYRALHEYIVSLGARVISIDRFAHDDAVAIVSHVPHMVASSLVRLAGEHAKQQPNLLRLAAGGFKDSTRIAAGSPKLWRGIAFDNADAVADGLAEMAGILGEFESAIRDEDAARLEELLGKSAEIRRELPNKWVPDSKRLVECRIPMFNRGGVVAEVTGIASSAGCNIQSIDIDHITEDSAVLELILTDEGDIGRLSAKLIDAGYDVSLRPLGPKE